MSLDTILQLIGLMGDLGVLLFALRGRLFRVTPVFCCYIAWCLLNDILYLLLNRYFSYFGQNYFRIYLVEMVLDSVFEFAVLVELGWAVLRPIRSSLPRYSILMLALLFAVAGAVIWPVSAHMVPGGNLSKSGILFVHAQQTIAVLRVVIFMALAGFSQLLSISWRNRELQIATGLGFYSMCSLAIFVIHTHQSAGTRPYHVMDQIGVATYVCSLAYWMFSFSQQEQERQEFTPQMRSFLLAVTGAARGTRMALADSAIGTPRKSEKP
ncbi:MAG TPA: hypothetical protein VGL00_00375 [Terracidiphilus sp.]